MYSEYPHDYSRVGGTPVTFTVRENLPNDPSIIREVAMYAEVDVAGKNVLDIGGHIGAYAVLATTLGAKFVTSVEALHANHALAAMNLKRNAKPGSYECLHGAAITDKRSTVDLYCKKTPSMNSLHVKGGTKRLTVPALNWVDLHRRRDYDVVKLDCEGSEYDLMLTDNGGGFPDSVQAAIVELHLGKKVWRRSTAPKLVEYFEWAGWRCVRKPEIRDVNWVTLGIWTR